MVLVAGQNVHIPTTEPGVIVLSERVQFNKVLQKRLPPDPDSIASSSSFLVDADQIITTRFSSTKN